MPAYRCVLAVYLRPVDKLIRQTVNTHTIQAYANLELYTLKYLGLAEGEVTSCSLSPKEGTWLKNCKTGRKK